MGCGASKTAAFLAPTETPAPLDDKPMVLFVLGGPGSGKGTQCTLLVEEFKYVHISAGDCLREEQNREGSTDGALIKEYIKEGKIVPVEITIRLLLNKMKSIGNMNPFLIDGFPRNLDNFDGFEKHAGGAVHVMGCLFIDCSEEVMLQRILSRAESSGRSDDNVESAKKRFAVFNEETMPIVNAFGARGKLYKASGEGNVESVWAEVKLQVVKCHADVHINNTKQKVAALKANTQSAASGVATAATEAATNAKNTATEAVTNAKNTATEAVTNAKNTTTEAATEAATNAKNTATEAVTNAKNTATEAVTNAKNTATEAATEAATNAKNTATEAVVSKVEAAAAHVQEATTEATKKTQEGLTSATNAVISGTTSGLDKLNSGIDAVNEKMDEVHSATNNAVAV